MSYVKTFTVGNLTVNAAMSSAVQQDELLSLLSAGLIERVTTAARFDTEAGDKVFVPMFMSMPQQLKRQVVGLLTQRLFIAGSEPAVAVTVNDFAGKMVEWNTLLSQLLQWNLEGFFVWLDSAVKDARPAANEQEV